LWNVTAQFDTLIVGGDSLIGRHVADACATAGQKARATSRRPDSYGIRLDLSEPDLSALGEVRFDRAVLCAAVTNMQVCQKNPEATRRVNVTGTLDLMRHFAERGVTMVYLSSSQVFDGERLLPDEASLCAPKNVYGQQKRDVEEAIAMERLPVAVLRVPKVLARQPIGMFAGWNRSLGRQEAILAATNIPLAAVSADDVAAVALRLASERAGGIWHLSSSDEVPYYQAAIWMAESCGFPPSLVRPEAVSETKVPAIFRHRHAALATGKIASKFGVRIRPVRDTLAELFAAFPAKPDDHQAARD
jgi:dTDP-4-dehydrorhamnose reductase